MPQIIDLRRNAGLAWCLWLASTFSLASPLAAQERFVLGSRSFTIPYTVEAGNTPRDIHLFFIPGVQKVRPGEDPAATLNWQWSDSRQTGISSVSSNRSTTSSKPKDTPTEFRFDAPADGLYWFSTWISDGIDTRPDPSGLKPELVIQVDTTAPKIEIMADSDGDGRIRGETKIEDQTTSKVQVRYITESMESWKSIDDGEVRKIGTNHYGFAFEPADDWKQLSVQIIAVDEAGNQHFTDKGVIRPRVANRSPDRFADARFNATGNAALPQFAMPGPTGLDLPPDDGASVESLPTPADPFESVPTPSGTSIRQDLSLPSLVEQREERERRQRAALEKQRSLPLKNAIKSMNEPSLLPPGLENAPEDIATPNPRLNEKNVKPAGPQARPNQTERLLALRPTLQTQVPIRYSASNRFSLDYVLEAVGARGVNAVELYGSLNEGRSWKLWGQDPDLKSPFDIEVREEGVFGYRIVVASNSGLASPRPIAGQRADIIVVVDQTKPELRITEAQYGRGDATGALVIDYVCQDPNLTERPISLAYAENQDGDWITIAGGLRNTGRYVWPADPNLPRAFYLRIDAKDAAGNVATEILDDPIDAQGLAPRARIQGIQTGF
ncbi:MAG: hypothetical protein AAF664_01080 [Planctomycetota bacterium]